MTRALAAISIAVVLACPPADACGPRDVCLDVVDSFIGQVESEGFAPTVERVELEWATDDDKPQQLIYRLYRYNCAVPETCLTPLAAVHATGTCGHEQLYRFTDTPPPPVGHWTYRLVVTRRDNIQLCSVDAIPE